MGAVAVRELRGDKLAGELLEFDVGASLDDLLEFGSALRDCRVDGALDARLDVDEAASGTRASLRRRPT